MVYCLKISISKDKEQINTIINYLFFMFGNVLLARIEKLEQCFAEYDKRAEKSLILETELTAQVKEITISFKEFAVREAECRKEKARRDMESSKDNIRILEGIKSDIHSIKNELATQPKEVAVQLLTQKEEIRNYCEDTFCSKEELTSSIDGIKRQAKFLWAILTASTIGIVWIIDTLIKLSPFIMTLINNPIGK